MKSNQLKKQILKEGLGLALGGGAVRGFFHIGILLALEERKISISYIAGISIGSLIGGLYAMGYSANEVLTIMNTYTNSSKLWQSVSPTLLNKTGFFSGKTMIKEINKLANNRTIEQLDIPFICRAADIIHFKEVIFSKGNVGSAIKASCSIPGVFTAEENKADNKLVDGCILGSVPISLLRKFFHGPILASNLITYNNINTTSAKLLQTAFQNDIFSKILPFTDTMIRSYYLMQSRISQLEYQLDPPEMAIDFDGFYYPNVTNIKDIKDRLVDDGYRATILALEKINL